MERNRPLSKFLRNGLYYGAAAGCVSALIFIIPITFILGISIRSFNLILSFFILAISFGFFPAVIIACLYGLISGLVYFVLQGQIANANRSRILSLVLSLGLATSAMTLWVSFFFNGFEVKSIRFSWDIYLLVAPFCVAGGLFVGSRLNKITINSNKIAAPHNE